VYFSNKLVPLNADGYGGLFLELLDITRSFLDDLTKVNSTDDEFARYFELKSVTAPHSNLVCFFVRPRSMTSLEAINEFNANLIHHFFPRPTNHIQDFDYFVSKTKLHRKKLLPESEAEIFRGLERDAESLQLMRLVFLNQWSQQKCSGGKTYLEDFLDQIKAKCLEQRAVTL
jgi:hypothetical protein